MIMHIKKLTTACISKQNIGTRCLYCKFCDTPCSKLERKLIWIIELIYTKFMTKIGNEDTKVRWISNRMKNKIKHIQRYMTKV